MSNLETYLSVLVHRGGSDLHLVANRVPRVRVDGRLLALDEPALSVEDLEGLMSGSMLRPQGSSTGRSAVGQQSGDVTLHLESLGRFRLHCYSQGGLPALAIRFIPRRRRPCRDWP